MDSYPQIFPHRDQTPYPYNYYPSWEGVPPHVKADPPSTFGPCPHNSSFSYCGPTNCNGCWSHGYPPGYYSFRPPHPHPQRPQLYFHGPYAPYPDAYPNCFGPPPHYLADQGRSHCCGCPNHSYQRKDDSGLKIEEEKPEVESKDNGSSTLIRWPNYPYPVFWAPPGSVKDNEASKAWDSQQSGAWDRWIPPDMNSLKALSHGGEKKIGNQQTGGKKTQLPLPIIWMPSYDQPQEAAEKDPKEVTVSPNVADELPPKFKIIPVKLLENGDRSEKPRTVEDKSESGVHLASTDKESKIKNIPVKKMEESREKKAILPEKQKQGTGEKKASDNGLKKQASPGKSSKLPPVCLRIDPLPRRKTGNGSPRSPSPHGSKEKEKIQQEIEDRSTNKTDKEAGKNQDEVSIDSTKALPAKGVTEAAVACKSDHKTTESLGALDSLEGEKQGKSEGVGEGKLGKVEYKIEDGMGALEALDDKNVAEKNEKREKLSNTDAALIIQSAYRRFEVRRWEPIRKLRQIARIRGQVDDIKEQICSLEASSGRQWNEKRKLVIGEIIMNLLLQLDTIQGLHSNVREIRKSVARELVSLQEKLDYMASKVDKRRSPTDAGESLPKDEMSEVHHQAVNSSESNESTSDPKEPEQPSAEKNLVESLAANEQQEFEFGSEQIRSAEMLLGGGEGLDSRPKDLEEQHLSSETGLMEEELDSEARLIVKSQLVSEEPCFRPEEAAKPSTVQDDEIESMAESILELPAKDETSYLEEKEPPEPQQAMKDKLVEIECSLTKEESFSEDGLCIVKEEPDSKVEELHAVKDELVEPPSLNEGTFSEAGLCVAQEDKPVEEPHVVPVMNIQAGISNAEGSQFPLENHEESVSGNKTALGQNEESKLEQEEPLVKEEDCIVEEFVGGPEVDFAAGSPDFSCSESFTPEVGVQEDGVKNLKGENQDMLVPAVGIDLESPEYVNHHHFPALVVSENISSEQSNKGNEINSGLQHTGEVRTLPTEANSQAQTSPEVYGSTLKDQKGPLLCQEGSVSETNKVSINDIGENENLREMLEKLLEVGREQLSVISDLNGRVKDLEKKVAQKRKLRVKRNRASRTTF